MCIVNKASRTENFYSLEFVRQLSCKANVYLLLISLGFPLIWFAKFKFSFLKFTTYYFASFSQSTARYRDAFHVVTITMTNICWTLFFQSPCVQQPFNLLLYVPFKKSISQRVESGVKNQHRHLIGFEMRTVWNYVKNNHKTTAQVKTIANEKDPWYMKHNGSNVTVESKYWLHVYVYTQRVTYKISRKWPNSMVETRRK